MADLLDQVLGGVRGVQDVEVLTEIVGVLRHIRIEDEGVAENRRGLVRLISRHVDSDEFEALGEEGEGMLEQVRALLEAHYDALHGPAVGGNEGLLEEPPVLNRVGGGDAVVVGDEVDDQGQGGAGENGNADPQQQLQQQQLVAPAPAPLAPPPPQQPLPPPQQ